MKTIYKIIFISLLFINCKAQEIVDISTYNLSDNSNKYFKDINNNYANFTGTWENTTRNITFRVNLWKDEKVDFTTTDPNCFMDLIRGSYQIIQDAGTSNEIILHNSVKYYPQNNFTRSYVIILRSGYGVTAFGYIDDNCATYPTGQNISLSGSLKIKISNPGVSPSIAHWTVIRKGATFGGATFTVPTDIILTKVN